MSIFDAIGDTMRDREFEAIRKVCEANGLYKATKYRENCEECKHVVVGKKGVLGCSGRTMSDGGYMIVRPYFSCDYFKNKHAD
jgi:hypothetical protein